MTFDWTINYSRGERMGNLCGVVLAEVPDNL